MFIILCPYLEESILEVQICFISAHLSRFGRKQQVLSDIIIISVLSYICGIYRLLIITRAHSLNQLLYELDEMFFIPTAVAI